MRQPITISRRQFLSQTTTCLLAANLATLPACSSFQPKPFVTGRTITAPQGCTELLNKDPKGDC